MLTTEERDGGEKAEGEGAESYQLLVSCARATAAIAPGVGA